MHRAIVVLLWLRQMPYGDALYPETTEIKQTFRCPVEHNAHPVHQVDDTRCCFTHRFNWWLVRKEVAAIHGIVKVNPWGVALTLGVYRSVNATLGTYGVGSFTGTNENK